MLIYIRSLSAKGLGKEQDGIEELEKADGKKTKGETLGLETFHL
jgi:hypothetical protein